MCPDGTCSGDETSESCPADCSPASQCGDGTCDQAGGECESCAEDCPAGACEACGNGVCVASVESCASCAEDCGDCLACPESPEGAAPELKNAAICDFLDSAKCLLPFPNDFYLRADRRGADPHARARARPQPRRGAVLRHRADRELSPHGLGPFRLVWDSGSPPPEPRNVPPSGGPDPHAVPGSLPEMRALTAQFMGSGGITDVCEGVPCAPR